MHATSLVAAVHKVKGHYERSSMLSYSPPLHDADFIDTPLRERVYQAASNSRYSTLIMTSNMNTKMAKKLVQYITHKINTAGYVLY